MRKELIFYILSVLIWSLSIQFTNGQNQLSARIEDKTIFLNDGQKFETNLFDLNYIGQIENSKSKKYLILSGKQCAECDANISLYIISPADGPMKGESEQERFSYPGKLFDFLDNSLIAEYRTFYGEILNGITGLIWFQKELNNHNEWIESTFLIQVKDGELEFDTITQNINLTLEQVKEQKAWEITGINSTSEP